MARIYADNVVFLLRPGELARRPVVPQRAYSHTRAPRLAALIEAPSRATPRRSPWLALLVVAVCVLPPAALAWRSVAHRPAHHAAAIGASDAASQSGQPITATSRPGAEPRLN